MKKLILLLVLFPFLVFAGEKKPEPCCVTMDWFAFQREADVTVYRAIWFLIAGNEDKDRQRLNALRDFKLPMCVTLPCGKSKYFTKQNFPHDTLECKCGKLKYPHYFVLYEQFELND